MIMKKKFFGTFFGHPWECMDQESSLMTQVKHHMEDISWFKKILETKIRSDVWPMEWRNDFYIPAV